MRWILVIVVVVVIAWVVFSALRRRSPDERQSLEERRWLEQEAQRDEALRESQGFAGEWESFIERSPSARAAYERLQPHGQPALDRLADEYRQHGDAERLPDDAERIAREFESRRHEDAD